MKTIISKELYESYKKENDKLLSHICQYEIDSDIPIDIVLQYKRISRALIDYERAYHPLPGRLSTIRRQKTAPKFEILEMVQQVRIGAVDASFSIKMLQKHKKNVTIKNNQNIGKFYQYGKQFVFAITYREEEENINISKTAEIQHETIYTLIKEKINDENEKINERLFTIIKYLYHNPHQNRANLIELTPKGRSTTDRYLKILKDAHLIEFKGSRKTGGYYLTKETKEKIEKKT